MIEKFIIKDSGFHPFLISDSWQVAQLNYMVDQHIDNIKKVEVHFETDEVFVLLNGDAVLITAKMENTGPVFKTELMKLGTVYNVPKNIWHNIAMRVGSEVLIVEKSNTHLGDYKYFDLNEEQISDLKKNVSKSFDEINI